jgi:hypothetical protein
MKDLHNMPPPAGVKRAQRTGLGRWSAGKGAVATWGFPSAPWPVPVFFPIRTTDDSRPAPAEQPPDGVQLDLSL